MGVSIHEVVGTVQRAPEAASEGPAPRGHAPGEAKSLPVAEVRAFLAREAELAARVRAD